MKILVVEDELKTGNYLKQGLMEADFVVDLVSDGEDGLPPHKRIHFGCKSESFSPEQRVRLSKPAMKIVPPSTPNWNNSRKPSRWLN